MNLMLETILPDGTIKEDLMPQIVRPLTSADMACIKPYKYLPQKKQSALKRLSERHRNLARVIATGIPIWEAAAVTGYTPSRISYLNDDPAFKNLVRFYSEAKDEIFETMYEKLAGMGSEAADILRDRMEEKPDTIEDDMLLNMVKVGADRSGFGPQSTNVNVNVNIADRLNSARKRIAARHIDLKAEEIKQTTDPNSEAA
jgi:hypothetical protein